MDKYWRFDRLARMVTAHPLAPPNPPPGWEIQLAAPKVEAFSSQNHMLVAIDDLLTEPEQVISQAYLQNFAKISPQYPGVRSALDPAVCSAWLARLSPSLSEWFGPRDCAWEMRAYYSIVTTPPHGLAPIQRLPHFDGTDPAQVAMMLYLHRPGPGSGHGGTAFFRHRSTGLEALTEADFPRFAAALQADVARTGLPPAAYATDGEPHFERTHVVPGHFNSAVFYRGNILHSGVIDNAASLSGDPREGRLTINAFFRPVER